MDPRARYATLQIKNPIVVASAGITAQTDRMKRAEDAGAAAVVMKSLFENPIPRSGDPSPHMRVIRRKMGPLSGDSFYSYEQASHLDEYAYAEEVAKAKRSLEIPVIANLDCRSPQAWEKYARLVAQAGADAVEVKMCPHGESHGDFGLPEIVKLVKSTVKIPVVAKLLPQMDDPISTYIAVSALGADGVIMFNRLSGLDIDVEKLAPVMHESIAGFGGAWYIHYCLRWIAACYGRASAPICGSGGVGSGDDVIKYLLAGATAAELATLVILEGYSAITRVLAQIEEWMQRKQVRCLMDVVGTAAKKVRTLEQVDRKSMLLARIDPSKCIMCGKCQNCCFRLAVDKAEQSYQVNDRCEGCGLCLNVCDANALSLVRR